MAVGLPGHRVGAAVTALFELLAVERQVPLARARHRARNRTAREPQSHAVVDALPGPIDDAVLAGAGRTDHVDQATARSKRRAVKDTQIGARLRLLEHADAVEAQRHSRQRAEARPDLGGKG